MKRIARTAAGTLLLLSGLIVPAAVSTPTADAVSNQQICNASNSTYDFEIYIKASKVTVPMPVGRCESIFPRGGTIVRMNTRIYRVKYNSSSTYSECRDNTDFTPWSKADKIVFKVNYGFSC